MNALATPTMLPGAAAIPVSQGSTGRDHPDEPFSRCLDRAVDRDGAAPPAPGARASAEPVRARGRDDIAVRRDETTAAPDGGQADDSPADGAAPSDATEASDARRGARARGPRRVGHGDPRADAGRPLKDIAPDVSPLAPKAAAAGDGADAKRADDAEPRGVDTLLPGWPALPREAAAATPPTPVAGATAAPDAAVGAGDADLASAAPTRTDTAPGTVGAFPSSTAGGASGAEGDARVSARRAVAAGVATLSASAGASAETGTRAAPGFEQALQGAAETATVRATAGARPQAEGTALPAWSATAPSVAAPAPAPGEPTRIAHSQVAAPLDSPAFAPALATQVRWLVREGMQEARLALNPAEMGPVNVQIVIDGRDARIDFRADMAATRQALEASLPVLAAALDDSGLRLAGGGVHDGAGPRQGDHGAAPGSPWRARVSTEEPPSAALHTAATRDSGRERGLVDLVA